MANILIFPHDLSERPLLRAGRIHRSVLEIRLIISLEGCIHARLCMSTHVSLDRLSSKDLSSANLYNIMSQFGAGCVSNKCD